MLNLVKKIDLSAAFDVARKREQQEAQQHARIEKLDAAHSALGSLTRALVDVADDQRVFREYFTTLNIKNDYIMCYRQKMGGENRRAIDDLTVTKDGQFYKIGFYKTANLEDVMQKIMPRILSAFSTEELGRIQSSCADNFKYDVTPQKPWYSKILPAL